MGVNSDWISIFAGVRGAIHKRKNSPRQDYVEVVPENKIEIQAIPGDGEGIGPDLYDNSAGYIVSSISDGHGSQKHFRSEYGAKVAVKTANERFINFFKNEEHVAEIRAKLNGAKGDERRDLVSLLFEHAQRALIEIIDDWKVNVHHHFSENPSITDEDRRILGSSENNEDLQTLRRLLPKKTGTGSEKSGDDASSRPEVIYGATLITVAILGDLVVFAKIGDGEILVFNSDGEPTVIFEEKEPDIGDETHSLCSRDPHKFAKLALMHLTEKPIIYDGNKGQLAPKRPAMIMFSSDGLAKSFNTKEGFYKLGQDFMKYFADQWDSKILKSNLRKWLEEFSEEGSGDDISLCMLAHKTNVEAVNIVKEYTDPPPEVVESVKEKEVVEPTKEEEVLVPGEKEVDNRSRPRRDDWAKDDPPMTSGSPRTGGTAAAPVMGERSSKIAILQAFRFDGYIISHIPPRGPWPNEPDEYRRIRKHFQEALIEITTSKERHLKEEDKKGLYELVRLERNCFYSCHMSRKFKDHAKQIYFINLVLAVVETLIAAGDDVKVIVFDNGAKNICYQIEHFLDNMGLRNKFEFYYCNVESEIERKKPMMQHWVNLGNKVINLFKHREEHTVVFWGFKHMLERMYKAHKGKRRDIFSFVESRVLDYCARRSRNPEGHMLFELISYKTSTDDYRENMPKNVHVKIVKSEVK